MERILIIGCGGSGKSTLARQLSQKLNIPVIHLDKIWWRPGWEHISREEFTEIILKEMDKPQWIMDGNFNHTLPQRLQYCDTVLYLDFNRVACLFGVLKRILTTYGKVRPDMGDGCPERFSWEFLQWVWTFNEKNREKNYALLSNTHGVKVHILKNRRQVKRFLNTFEIYQLNL